MKHLIDLSTYQPIDLKKVKNLVSVCLNALVPTKKEAAFTLAEGATHVDMPPTRAKFAFTLAEVLITLGIIGIVAALTIPSLINNYKAKQLEVQFKKADSILTQSLKKAVDEAGYDSITDLYIQGSQVTSSNFTQLQSQVEELNQIWLRQFTGVTRLKSLHGSKCHSMDGSIYGGAPECWVMANSNHIVYQLQDGLTITELQAIRQGDNYPVLLSFLFDTNGPYKGPNRMGHDIFIFYSDIKYRTLCNPTSKNSYAVDGCYYWAKNNINPKDKTTPYWNVLYKPLSYWKK